MPYPKLTLLTSLLASTLLPVHCYAEQRYQAELTAGYEKKNADTSTDKIISLGAEIYFAPVNTENKPFAEAAFLDKSSSIGLGYFKQKTDIQNANINTFESDGPLVFINYITQTNAFILGAVYSKSDIDTDSDQLTGDSRLTGVNLGKYLDNSSVVEFSYLNSKTDIHNTTSNRTFSNDTDFFELSYKTVQPLNATNYYHVGASIGLSKNDSGSTKEDSRELVVSGDYYFNRMTSLGTELSFNSGDDTLQEGKTLDIRAAHFFTPQIALNIILSKFIADNNQTEDTDSISADLIARF